MILPLATPRVGLGFGRAWPVIWSTSSRVGAITRQRGLPADGLPADLRRLGLGLGLGSGLGLDPILGLGLGLDPDPNLTLTRRPAQALVAKREGRKKVAERLARA